MKIVAAALLILCASSCRQVILEGNTAGNAHSVIWFTSNGKPQTCFIETANLSEVTRLEPDTLAPKFSYGGNTFEAVGGHIVITDPAGRILKRGPLQESIFILTGGGFSEVQQNKEIVRLMVSDYGAMNSELIDHLKRDGTL